MPQKFMEMFGIELHHCYNFHVNAQTTDVENVQKYSFRKHFFDLFQDNFHYLHP